MARFACMTAMSIQGALKAKTGRSNNYIREVMTETDDVKSIAPFQEQNQKYARYATYASVTVASFLIILKVAAWSITNPFQFWQACWDS